ncbi:hypothetical protein [Halosimplex halobium]|uniref:hypothetical protein n=1 Tax=Halosimplex halobium TaxID=3396618 RepID=UPI003F57FDF2
MTRSDETTDSSSSITGHDKSLDLWMPTVNSRPQQEGDGVELFEFVLLLGSWAILVGAYLLVSGMFTAQSLFIGVFVGQLILVEVTTTNDPTAEKQSVLSWSARVGYLVFGYFIYNDVLALITAG